MVLRDMMEKTEPVKWVVLALFLTSGIGYICVGILAVTTSLSGKLPFGQIPAYMTKSLALTAYEYLGCAMTVVGISAIITNLVVIKAELKLHQIGAILIIFAVAGPMIYAVVGGLVPGLPFPLLWMPLISIIALIGAPIALETVLMKQKRNTKNSS